MTVDDRLVIETLALAEYDLTTDIESYRVLAQQALHALADAYEQHARQQRTIDNLRDELRRYTASAVEA